MLKCEKRVRPPVKWAGGKSQLIHIYSQFFPVRDFRCYIEPFVGGGAVFFHLQPEDAVLIDSNHELINFYIVVRDKLNELLLNLAKHINSAEYYYQLRALDPKQLSDIQRASRFLFLNKTSYNGLWRVNKKGQFNVPYGKYKNPRIKDEPNLRRVSQTLKSARIIHGDFGLALEFARPGTFVYLDPPYHPISKTSNFTRYTAGSFNIGKQEHLSRFFRQLDSAGCLVMLSNSDTPYIKELYGGYDIQVVHARRAINCRADKRGPVNELVIRNYL